MFGLMNRRWFGPYGSFETAPELSLVLRQKAQRVDGARILFLDASASGPGRRYNTGHLPL